MNFKKDDGHFVKITNRGYAKHQLLLNIAVINTLKGQIVKVK